MASGGKGKAKVGPFDHCETKPERESLQFSLNTSRLPTEMADVVTSIKKLAESLLFHWKTFPVILPPSITEQRSAKGAGDGNTKEGFVTFKDLFKTPTFDELEIVAVDEDGRLKVLNNEQLAMIQRLGEFEVTSINFPGQVHRWRLTNLLQKGAERTKSSFLQDLSKSLYLLIIVARDRLCGQIFSIKDGVYGWCRGFRGLLDIIIGVPSTTSGSVCEKLHTERMNYLVAELDIKSSLRKELDAYCGYIKMNQSKSICHTTQITEGRPSRVPYRYQTPSGQEIDLRLFNKDLINNSLGILSKILVHQAKGWHIEMRAKLIKMYQGQRLSNDEISKRVTEDVMSHYLDKVFQSISTNGELEGLQPGIGGLLVNQAKSVLVMMKARDDLMDRMDTREEELISHLEQAYPVKSRISGWMKEQIDAFQTDFARQNLWTTHENAISLCEEQGLHQTAYFLRRDLTFIKEREDVLKKELSKVKIPMRFFEFSTKIWFPHNWIVMKRDLMGSSEIIATVIREKERTGLVKKEGDSFIVHKSKLHYTSTRYPFWRWWNFLHRVWSYTWNFMYLFGVIIPWCSPVGLRALFSTSAFTPDLVQSSVDGSLYPRQSSLTHTLVSRLQALWSNVHLSRDNFEATPDRGFLGKSLTRHFNRLWNYVVKGVLGSVIILLAFPVICLVVSSLSVLLAVLSPLWVPLTTLVLQIFFFLVYDIDAPMKGNCYTKLFVLFKAVIWNIFLQGCIQPPAALVFGGVLCPVAAFMVTLFGLLRRGSRFTWDTLMFHAIIKTKGRVPSSDGFVARRIAGPGLAANYFYQIRPEQALAAVESTIEQDELDAWKRQIISIIDEPCKAYHEFVDQCFRPFSANLSQEGAYRLLSKETHNYSSLVGDLVNKRMSKLHTGLTPSLQRKIKLPEQDLKLTIMCTARMLEELYHSHVVQRSDFSEHDFWEGLGLKYKDWQGLASKKLSWIFSPSFMIPLEETDNCFELKVNHMNIRRYGEMLASANFHDDLDLVVTLHSPVDEINTRPPHLDVNYFYPCENELKERHTLETGKRRCNRARRKVPPEEANKLEIPLPIRHPAYIAVAIYNRENDQDPINTGDPGCLKIIQASIQALSFHEKATVGERVVSKQLPRNRRIVSA